jgi:hypothetical protein
MIMKYRIVPLTVVAMCLGLPSLAMSRPNEDMRVARDEPRAPQHEGRDELRGGPGDDHKGGPRDEPRREPVHEPMHEGPPGARPPPPMEHERAGRYEEHLRLEQEAARARRLALLRDERRWDEERHIRAEAHRRAIAQEWVHVSNRPAARAELSIHADRMARLNRALDLAEGSSDTPMISRINELIRRENARHARIMASIQAGAE